ncbi:hypothetical protein [Chitinophaga sp. RAB17]|uniref:hypothetical protein n=1 Tax=Chitinophaga sp. RAB17 TaxID=3233049 RepID=UPI003F90853C
MLLGIIATKAWAIVMVVGGCIITGAALIGWTTMRRDKNTAPKGIQDNVQIKETV